MADYAFNSSENPEIVDKSAQDRFDSTVKNLLGSPPTKGVKKKEADALTPTSHSTVVRGSVPG